MSSSFASSAGVLTTVTLLTFGAAASPAAARPAASKPAARPVTGHHIPAPPVAPAVRFDPGSWLYRDVRRAPVAANSAAMVRNLHRQVVSRYHGIAAVNAYRYNAGFYRVSANTPGVNVSFYDCQHKGYVPDGLLTGRKQFVSVPIPRGAVPAAGTDGNLTVYRPATHQLWEFWVARRDSRTNRWKACWGGRMDNVSRSRRAAFYGNYGATATGVSIAGSMISVAEARAHQINHAMYLAIPEPKKYTSYSWPARRSDGTSTRSDAIPEGTVLRLDPRLDVNKLHLTAFGRAVARAAQKHGFIVADKAGAVNVSTESGAAEKARTGKNPWDAIFGGVPDYRQLTGFPWSRLQALPTDYGH